jgi:hypothetical protein
MLPITNIAPNRAILIAGLRAGCPIRLEYNLHLSGLRVISSPVDVG